jgi:hypothetical protein
MFNVVFHETLTLVVEGWVRPDIRFMAGSLYHSKRTNHVSQLGTNL